LGGVGSGEQEADLGAAENFLGAAWSFCAQDTGGGVAAGGSAKQAAHGRQIHVARARQAPLADQVEQELSTSVDVTSACDRVGHLETELEIRRPNYW
jgi:hypothetical protein